MYIGSHTKKNTMSIQGGRGSSAQSFVITSWGRRKIDYSNHVLLYVHNFLCNIPLNSGQFQCPLLVKHNRQNLRLLPVLLGLVELYPCQDFDNSSMKIDSYPRQKLIVKVIVRVYIIENRNL